MKINLKKLSVATMSLSYILLSPLSHADENRYQGGTVSYEAEDSGNPLASEGLVTINGQVVAQTCEVESGAKNITVNLQPVNQNALSKAGNVAAPQTFHIKLDKCTAANEDDKATYQNVGISFSSTLGEIDKLNKGTLLNTILEKDGGAQNVNVQLLNEDGTEIDFASDTQNTIFKTLPDGSVEFSYQARYYATKAATAGSVKALVPFSIIYQ